MKKNYEAPALEIITYSLHEAIAAGCTIKQYPNMGNGVDSCKDPLLADFVFGKGEAECDGNGATIEGYCYFTSNGSIVSTS